MSQTIFDLIDRLTRRSSKDLDISEHQIYSPYIVNRFLSQRRDDICYLINSTVNVLHEKNHDKDFHYRFLRGILPRGLGKKFIRYIKKAKNKSTDVGRAPEIHELSRREIELYVEQFNVDVSRYCSK